MLGLARTATAAALDEKATPEQVAELYMRAFVNRDMEAAVQLNEYLKPFYDGHEAYRLADLRKFATNKPKEDEERAKSIAADAPTAQRATLERAFLNFFQGVDQAVVSAKCRTIGAKIGPDERALRWNPERKSAKAATVEFQCKIPALDPAIAKSITEAVAAENSSKLLAATEKFKVAMTKPAQWKTVSGSHTLMRDLANAKDRWNNPLTEGWVSAIVEGMPSLK